MHSIDLLLDAQRALRSRFNEFRLAVQRINETAAEIALGDFEKHLRTWTEAEEKALIPALQRAQIPGRDVKRELRLEYVQIRELSRFILQQISEGTRPNTLTGYIDNLDRRLHAHESEMEKVYYPAAEKTLTSDEWKVLEEAKPEL
ncbi:MAG TPA: hemerythrin domain-containing protein [Thermoanaerobaculia bacterium]|jgi:hypothetical protein|nr:hemerythrin domain-containing protein [Thermoanaerobaculia bacterium]